MYCNVYVHDSGGGSYYLLCGVVKRPFLLTWQSIYVYPLPYTCCTVLMHHSTVGNIASAMVDKLLTVEGTSFSFLPAFVYFIARTIATKAKWHDNKNTHARQTEREREAGTNSALAQPNQTKVSEKLNKTTRKRILHNIRYLLYSTSGVRLCNSFL